VSRPGVLQYSPRGKPGAGGGVVAFAIDPETGALKHLNTQPSMGANPTAVIIDKTNSRVVVANHGAVNKIVVISKRNGVRRSRIRQTTELFTKFSGHMNGISTNDDRKIGPLQGADLVIFKNSILLTALARWLVSP
jgi:6-phosphogluconolactonase (cycloisomerase 2 family)